MSIFDRLFRRESRASIKSSDPFLAEYFNAGGPRAHVDPARASGLAVAQACISIVSQNLAAIPLTTYRIGANGGREKADDHPLYAIMSHSVV